jgi:putative copper export protein
MLGETSFGLLWVWVLAVVILALALVYGIRKTGHLTSREKRALQENTKARQRSEDSLRR